MRTVVTWLPVLLTASLFSYLATPPREKDDEFHIRRFGRLPVVYNGRAMPIDSLARTSLMLTNGGKDTFKENVAKEGEPEKYVTQPAVKWYLDVLISGGLQGPAMKHKVYYITDLDLLNLLGFNVEERKDFRFRYSLDELRPKIDVLQEAVDRIKMIDPKNRKPLDNHTMELASKIELYLRFSHFDEPHFLYPRNTSEEWKKLIEGAREKKEGGLEHPALASFSKLIQAYEANDIPGFNRALEAYEADVEKFAPNERFRGYVESTFNAVSPFGWTMMLYWLVFALAAISWLAAFSSWQSHAWFRALRASAFYLCILLFAVHTIGICTRMWLQGRPPVTNLYSSALFIGWTAVGTVLFMESVFKNSVLLAMGSVIGGATLIVAYYLGVGEDTMGMLQAVLDTNFWLATHVTTITFGYSATFLAGGFAAAYILLGVFTGVLRGEPGVMLGKAVYGIICFATLLSFVGTVLGGIWADYSWGRFWGWDPKENGALMIVIWNALILHARWGGMVKARGIAVLALVGNCITSWSWFGTNLLGVGLHAYGFMAGAYYGVLGFCALNLVLMGIGLIPLGYWASFRPEPRRPAGRPSEPFATSAA